MPIQVASFLVPVNSNSWFLVEDSYFRGGFRVCVDHTERDAIHSDSRKQGMLVSTNNDGQTWQLGSDLITWGLYASSAVAAYTFKGINSQTWNIVHGKNCLYYTYTCIDSSGKVVIPDEITTVDANTINISWTAPFTGSATFIFDLGA